MASQINPDSMIAIASALPAVCIITVGARFYIRTAHGHGLQADDWLILPALLMVIGIGIAIIIGVEQKALGYPAGTADLSFLGWALVFASQLEFGVYIMSQLVLCFSKLSLLFFYRRIFYTGSNKAYDIFTKVLAAVIILWSVAEIFEFIFTCGTQVYLRWGTYQEIKEKCASPEATNLFLVSFDVFLDLILFVMPIPSIIKLQLSKGRRLGLLLVFAVGALAVVTSVIRLVIFVLVLSGQASAFVGGDILIIISLFFYWTMFEAGISVIVTCLPILQILFRKASVETARRNVLGIFSVQSLGRFSQKSGSDKSSHVSRNIEDAHSSSSNLHEADKPLELDEISQHSSKHPGNR